jgi:hypothetical protein
VAITTRAQHLTNSGQTAAEFRQQNEYGVGVRAGVFRTASTSWKVTERGAGANMSVDVAVGAGAVPATESGNTGVYLAESQSVTNVVISAADGTNPRIDLIVVRVKDQDFASGSPSTNTATIEVVTGTAAASPAVPTIPANCLLLARVDVAAASATVVNANITDRRWNAFSTHSAQDNGGLTYVGGIIPASSTARPQSPYESMLMWEDDTDTLYANDGSLWISLANFSSSEFTYTPAVTQSGSVTVTVNHAAYQKVGRRVIGNLLVSVSGSGTGGNAISISLPHATSSSTGFALGHGYLLDSSASAYYPFIAYRSGASAMTLLRTAHEGTTPFLGVSGFTAALAAGDVITCAFTYLS